MNKKIRHLVARPIAATLALICTIPTAHAITPKTGAIYFNGWGDSHHEIGINNGNLIKSWPERQPVWNYYSNSVSYMEDEIDAAVNIGGIDFFAFLYYPALDGQVDGNYLSNPRNKCFSNYFNASNHYDIEWCVFFSNHAPYQPDTAYWKQIINHLCGTGYFNNSRYLKVNGRPVIMVFDRANFNAEGRSEGVGALFIDFD